MAVQLLILRGVPDDEAEELRSLLADNAVKFYETPAGNWGVSMPAIWLPDDQQLTFARQLIDSYQAERAAKTREAYAQLKAKGEHRTIAREFRDNPLKFIAFLALATLVLFFSIKPFVDMTG